MIANGSGPLKIGVIGGGFTGMALAYRLSSRGHAVTVFERDRQVGGLATHHDYGPFVWDRFYHCILPSDRHLIRLLNDIGLSIVLVTHEHDIAQFAKRVLVFRDGRIRKDDLVLSRPRASEVLKTLPTLED